MLVPLLLLLMARITTANVYYFQPNGCSNETLYSETNEIETDEPCDQLANSFHYRIKTSAQVPPSELWKTRPYAEFRLFSDDMCQIPTTWKRYQLDGPTYSTIWGQTKAKCEIINGVEYFFFEDALEQKFFVSQTNACVDSLSFSKAIITCHKREVAPGSSRPSVPTNESSSLRSSLVICLCFVLYFIV